MFPEKRRSRMRLVLTVMMLTLFSAVTITSVMYQKGFFVSADDEIGTGGSDGNANGGDPNLIEMAAYAFDPLTSGNPLKPDQGLEGASVDHFMNVLLRNGYGGSSRLPQVRQACVDALNDLHKQGVPQGHGRIVGILWAKYQDSIGVYKRTTATWEADANKALSIALKNLPSKFYDQPYKNTGRTYRQEVFFRLKNVYGGVVGCLAVGSDFPKKSEYKLNVTTTAQMERNGKWTPIPNTVTTDFYSPRSDLIKVTRSGEATTENLTAFSRLIRVSDKKIAQKQITISSNGGTIQGPTFRPADFGAKTWGDDSYFFDVYIPKQGSIKETVDTPDTDPNERFQNVSPKTNKAWFRPGEGLPEDPNWTNKVGADGKTFLPGDPIGAVVNFTVGKGEVILEDDYSNNDDKVDFTNANVKVFENGIDSTSSYVITNQGKKVTAVRNTPLPGVTYGKKWLVQLVLEGNVRTVENLPKEKEFYTRTNSGKACVEDDDIRSTGGNPNAIYVDKRFCLPTNVPPVNIAIPAHNKAWVHDEEEGKTTDDPQWTNMVALDGETVTAGQEVSTVVVSHQPKGVKYTAFALRDTTDTLNDLIIFNKANTRYKVIIDNEDVTSLFTFTKEKGNILATGNDALLRKISDRPADFTVRLIMTTTVRGDVPKEFQGQAFTIVNRMTGTYNSLVEKPGNTPKVYIEYPESGKVWASNLDEAKNSHDKEWTNKVASDGKTFLPGDTVYTAVPAYVPSFIHKPYTKFVIKDNWDKAASWIDYSKGVWKVYKGTEDVTDQFTITTDGHVTSATMKSAYLKGATYNLSSVGEYRLVGEAKVRENYDVAKEGGKKFDLSNSATNEINTDGIVEYNTPPVSVVPPKPDKVWGMNTEHSKELVDPEWTNKVGIDTKAIMPGDEVSVTVNGKVPAGLANNMTKFVLGDDYTESADWVNFVKDGKFIVVEGIGKSAKDITGQFTITTDEAKHLIVATAKPEFLNSTKAGVSERTVKLIATANARARTTRDEVSHVYKLPNDGYMEFNNVPRKPTNKPWIEVHVNDPAKVVRSSFKQDGDWSINDGKKVFPGQWLSYQVDADVTVAENYAYDAKYVAILDEYDSKFVPDKSSIRLTDLRNNGEVISPNDYKVEWGTNNVKVIMNADWIEKNTGPKKPGFIRLTFDGKVKSEKELGKDVSDVINSALEIFNRAELPTPKPKNPLPPIQTDKKVTDVAHKVDLNGRYFFPGDELSYDYRIDAFKPKNLSYNVHKLGAVDDYDEGVLNVDAKDIVIKDEAEVKAKGFDKATNYTDKFWVVVENGNIYTFAKFVEHTTNEGNKLPTEAPKDWAKYASALEFNPMKDGIIDQGILGKDYRVYVKAQVKPDLKAQVTFTNEAFSMLESKVVQSNKVTNSVEPRKPHKDVTQTIGGASIDNQKVPFLDDFYYRLDSSVFKGNYAYQLDEWVYDDDFDETKDKPNGEFKVLNNEGKDVTNEFTITYKDKAGKELKCNKPNGGILDCGENVVVGKFTVTATKVALDNMNKANEEAKAKAGDKAGSTEPTIGFKVFVGFDRIAKNVVSENDYDETINGKKVRSNKVRTTTPDEKPHKDVTETDGGKSIDGGKVLQGKKFYYDLKSSVKHRNSRGNIENWYITDDFDETHDQPTGKVRVVLDSGFPGGELRDDLKPAGGTGTAKPVEAIKAGSDITKYATVTWYGKDGKEVKEVSKSVSFKVELKPEFLKELNSVKGEFNLNWSAKVEINRISYGDVKNTLSETFNKNTEGSNTVTTHTPPPPPPPSLPNTGSEAEKYLGAGIVMLLLGAGVVLLSRRTNKGV